MNEVTVGEIAKQVRGVSYGKADVQDRPAGGYLPILRANNITDNGLSFDDLVFVRGSRISDTQRLKAGDIVIAASSGSLSVVGKAAQVGADQDAAFGAFCKVVRPGPKVHPTYLGHFFRTPAYRSKISSLAAGANINNLRSEHIDDLAIPLPSLPEQRRIAAILDQADALRRQRRQSLSRLSELGQAIFFEMFGDVVINSRGWDESYVLDDVADVSSGITKGRKANGQAMREVPYLAVSNVQDGEVRLNVVKTIEATDAEIQRFALRPNDIVLTEGGDPDKLGRGGIWHGEIAECIHQNHVFRVRITDPDMRPLFLSRLIGSERGKRYFLRSAKQTTGIASINMTQLKNFPLLSPPKKLQLDFDARMEKLKIELKRAELAHMASEHLFASLQHRAFRGEL